MTVESCWFEHVGLLVPDVSKTASFYVGALGMETVGRGPDGLMLADGVSGYGLRLVLCDSPQAGWQNQAWRDHGPRIDHVGYRVPVDELISLGIRLDEMGASVLERPNPDDPDGRLVFRDPAGAVVVVRGEHPIGATRPITNPVTAPSLHHGAIVGPNLVALNEFYAATLGLTNAYQHGQGDGGFAFLADPGVVEDPAREGPILETVGPPGLWELETGHLDRHGPGLYHICFAVPDVDAAYARLRVRGQAFEWGPLDDDHNRLAFFRDPDGILVELMLPVTRVHRSRQTGGAP